RGPRFPERQPAPPAQPEARPCPQRRGWASARLGEVWSGSRRRTRRAGRRPVFRDESPIGRGLPAAPDGRLSPPSLAPVLSPLSPPERPRREASSRTGFHLPHSITARAPTQGGGPRLFPHP